MNVDLLVTRPMTTMTLAVAQEHFNVTVRESTQPCSVDEMCEALRTYKAVMPTLGDMFSAEVFAQVPQPRTMLLANFGVGYNHIDVAAAREAGIAVTNTPGAVTDATADIAMTLILMSARRAGEGERLVRSGAWQGWHPTQMLGQHISGKTVGIVGMGRIGQAVAHRCHYGFGMQVRYASRSPKDLPFPAERMDLLDLAQSVDVLVIAVPGGAATHHMIGAEVFAAMKADARLVNIARGDVIDENALIAALEAEEIAGAGLDVYEFEPKVPQGLIRENVVLLPHLGTAAEEVRTDMGLMAVENLRAFFAGEPLRNPV